MKAKQKNKHTEFSIYLDCLMDFSSIIELCAIIHRYRVFFWCINETFELLSSRILHHFNVRSVQWFQCWFLISNWLCKCWSKFKLCRIVIMTLMTYKFYQFTALNAKFLTAICTHLGRYSKLNMWKALTKNPKKKIFISIKPPFICLQFFVCESVFSRSHFASFPMILCYVSICILWQEPPTLTKFSAKEIKNGNWLHNFIVCWFFRFEIVQ